MIQPVAQDARSTALATVTGTATDGTGVGVGYVELRIQRSDGNWYDWGGGWTGNAGSWQPTTYGSGQWTQNVSALPWTEGFAYYINSRAQDLVQVPGPNYEASFTTHTYIFDYTAPIAQTIIPGNISWQGALPFISGTANDPTTVAGGVPSDVKKVELSIQRLSDNLYWDGSTGFNQPGIIWSTATLTSIAFSSYSWTYNNINNNYWINNTSYTVGIKATDNVGNVAWGTTNYFVFDTTPPVCGVVVPNGVLPSYPQVNLMPMISGTASDYGLGQISSVQIQIKNVDDSNFWNPGSPGSWGGATWINTTFNQATGVWTFSTTSPAVTWKPYLSASYEIKARAIDMAGNICAVMPVGSFMLVPPRPQSAITTVTNGSFYKQITSLGGTASQAGSGIAQTMIEYVRIQRQSNGLYYTQFSTNTTNYWVAQSTWMVASITLPDWTYDLTTTQFVHDSSYTVSVCAESNESILEWNPPPWGTDTTPSAPNSLVTFWIDNQPPVLGVGVPATVYTNSLPVITGTCQDIPSGPNNISVSIQRADNYYWSVAGSSWTITQVWNSTTSFSGGIWQLAISTNPWRDGTSYTLQVRAYDNVIPTPNSTLLPGQGFIYDISCPTATLTYPAQNSIMSSVSSISGGCSDTPPGQLQNVQILIQRCDGNDWRYWKDLVSDQGWKLSPVWNNVTSFTASSWTWTTPGTLQLENNATYYVTVSALDMAGNQQTSFAVGISSYYFRTDLQPPAVTVTFPTNNLNFSPSGSFNFTGNITDNLAGGTTVNLQLSKLDTGVTYYWTGAAWSVNVSSFNAEELGTGSLNRIWSEPFNNWASDKQYTIKARGYDAALPVANLGDFNSGNIFTFVIDTTPPNSYISAPQNNSMIPALSAITGTAIGDLAGIQSVSVSIQRIAGTYSDGNYWNNEISNWVSISTWCPTIVPQGTGPQTWSYTVPAGLLINGNKYQIISRALDRALNYDVVLSTITFLYDQSAPVTVITVPSGIYYGPQSALNTISGTAADYPISPSLNSGLSQVFLRIQRSGDNYYWNNNAWVANSSTWSVVSGTSSWTYNGLAWDDGRIYNLNSCAVDFAGNLSAWTTSTFRWDSTSPLTGIVSPAGNWVSNLPYVSGTAYDAPSLYGNKSGLQQVSVAFQQFDSQQWFEPGQGFNQGTTYWITASNYVAEDSTVTWTVPNSSTPTWANGKTYTMLVMATDMSNNQSVINSTVFTFDQTLPTIAITMPNQTAESTLPIISGTASDVVGSNPGSINYVQMRVYDESLTEWYSRVDDKFEIAANAPETAWYLATNTSTWTVWYSTFTQWVPGRYYDIDARVLDQAGNWCAVYSTKTFLCDTLPPTVVVTKPAAGQYWSALGTISGTAQDMPFPGNYSGTGFIKIAVRSNTTGLWFDGGGFNLGTPPTNFSVGSGDGPWGYYNSTLGGLLQSGASYYITNQASDIAGNTDNWYNVGGSTFVYDNTPPNAQITIPNSSGGFYSSLATISGTAADVVPAPSRPLVSGVKTVQFTVQDVTAGVPQQNLYWQNPGGGWSTSSPSTWTALTAEQFRGLVFYKCHQCPVDAGTQLCCDRVGDG